ncbi:uncharacterized protein ZBIST_2615 [Zygosaccharomyces bailii]|nr:uncharacterized protein ZBIST_2615 [Zygosaccharomyces bailii]
MQDVWQDQMAQDQMPESTESDYFEALSSPETCESASEDTSDEESEECLTHLPLHHKCDSDQKVMPILIHEKVTDTRCCRVQIQTPIKVSSRSRRTMPRTPIPGYTDPHAQLTQSAWENFESKQKHCQLQKPELQMSNSAMLRRREAKSVAI